MGPLWAHFGPIMGPIWAQNGPIGPNVGPYNGPSWAQHGPNVYPKWARTWAHHGPVLGPFGVQYGAHIWAHIWARIGARCWLHPRVSRQTNQRKNPLYAISFFFARVQVSDHQPRVGSGYTLRETILAPVHETARVEKCCDSSGHRTTIDLGQSFQDIGLAVCQSTPSQSNPPGWVSAISRLSVCSWPREIESAAQPQRYLWLCYLS
jgi:hypothetical protein